MGNLSQSYEASLAIWDHTVLPATWHKWTCPAITPAKQASTWFTYPGRMEGWVDPGCLIVARPGYLLYCERLISAVCCLCRILNFHTEIHSGLRRTFRFRRRVRSSPITRLRILRAASIRRRKTKSLASSVGRLPPTASATLATSRWKLPPPRHVSVEARME